MSRLLTVCLAIALAPIPAAAEADDNRARVNYMLHCQGCHLPEAVGFPGKVPRMKDFAGYFLHSQAGREFLIRVPGVATSQLGDVEIAELMNWYLLTYSAAQLPDDFERFTAEEVGVLRQEPVIDPATSRRRILGEIAAAEPTLRSKLDY